MNELLPKLALTAAVVGAAGYLGMGRYTQSRDTYRQIEPVHQFLIQALAHDSLAMIKAADEQPVRWALAATRLDSAAVREWAGSRPQVRSTRRGDTVWVTLRRPGSTERCSPLYPLTAGFVHRRLVHLSSSCPDVFRTAKRVTP